MKLGAHIVEGLSPLVDLVYPPRCPLCGEGVAQQGGLCTPCWSTLVIPGEPSCSSCSRPFANADLSAQAQCAVCMANPPRHDGICAGTLYNEPSRKLILAFKHGGKIALAPLLARLIAARLPERVEGQDAALIVPVPLHRWRLWRRGYNQAALLARELAKLGAGELVVDGLIRTKPTPSLGGLGRQQRERALAGAIAVKPSLLKNVCGKDIILVDDVLTSGATSDACVATLKRAGARSVRIACFARVLDEALDVKLDVTPSADEILRPANGAAKNETPEVH